MCRLFPCIPIFRGFFLLKSVKKMFMCGWVKITLLLVKNVFFDVKKGISELWHRVVQKHTTNELH